MTTTLLIPLDGSLLAERALPFGARLARASGARIVLVRVLPGDAARGTLALGEVRACLDQAAGVLRQQGFEVDTAEGVGEPAVEILRAASQHDAGLLVMSTHGRSGPSRWIYGSVADAVDRSPRILVPLDGSELGESALTPARDWAARLGAELILLEVASWPPMIYGDGTEMTILDPDDNLRMALEYLDDVALRWRTDVTPIRTRAILGRPTPTAIAQVAAEEHVDLIAMATHGRSGVARVVLGSVATGTLQRVDVPVLVVRPPALVAAAAA
jgi:nucleotide-binding universal stress UspA family protein